MTDLIYRDALLAAGNVRKMKDALEDWDTLDNKTKIIVLRYAKAHKKLVESIPVVDAVPVVRCKDCRHWEEIKHGHGWCCASTPNHALTKDDDYCSHGERRTDGSTD